MRPFGPDSQRLGEACLGTRGITLSEAKRGDVVMHFGDLRRLGERGSVGLQRIVDASCDRVLCRVVEERAYVPAMK